MQRRYFHPPKSRSRHAIGVLILLIASSTPGHPAEKTQPSVSELVNGINTFGWELYKQITSQPKTNGKNVSFSPLGIYTALAVTLAGARGKTEQQIAKVLHCPTTGKAFHSALGKLLQEERKTDPEPPATRTFKIDNSLWLQENYPFSETFIGFIRKCYGVSFRKVDFAHKPQEALFQIRDQMEKAIIRYNSEIPSGLVTSQTRLIVINLTQFSGRWERVFLKSCTGTFHCADGKEKKVRFMKQTASFPYAETDRVEILRMPYAALPFAMDIILPKKGISISEVERKWSTEKMRQLTDKLKEKLIKVEIPPFEFRFRCPLETILSKMGMQSAFDPAKADFSGMTTGRRVPLWIHSILHDVRTTVNRSGTQITAITWVACFGGVSTRKSPQYLPTFRADRPFMFVVRDIQRDVLVFVGRVMEP